MNEEIKAVEDVVEEVTSNLETTVTEEQIKNLKRIFEASAVKGGLIAGGIVIIAAAVAPKAAILAKRLSSKFKKSDVKVNEVPEDEIETVEE